MINSIYTQRKSFCGADLQRQRRHRQAVLPSLSGEVSWPFPGRFSINIYLLDEENRNPSPSANNGCGTIKGQAGRPTWHHRQKRLPGLLNRPRRTTTSSIIGQFGVGFLRLHGQRLCHRHLPGLWLRRGLAVAVPRGGGATPWNPPKWRAMAPGSSSPSKRLREENYDEFLQDYRITGLVNSIPITSATPSAWRWAQPDQRGHRAGQAR